MANCGTGYFILENPTEPIPPPLPLRDPSCRYRTEFHILDESQLSYTLPPNQSALFVDIDNGERIAVVIRNFARSYFPAIQQWPVPLLHDSISRRTLSLRNNPGQLARVGVSEGPRNARLFGWVRNLKSVLGQPTIEKITTRTFPLCLDYSMLYFEVKFLG